MMSSNSGAPLEDQYTLGPRIRRGREKYYRERIEDNDDNICFGTRTRGIYWIGKIMKTKALPTSTL